LSVIVKYERPELEQRRETLIQETRYVEHEITWVKTVKRQIRAAYVCLVASQSPWRRLSLSKLVIN